MRWILDCASRLVVPNYVSKEKMERHGWEESVNQIRSINQSIKKHRRNFSLFDFQWVYLFCARWLWVVYWSISRQRLRPFRRLRRSDDSSLLPYLPIDSQSFSSPFNSLISFFSPCYFFPLFFLLRFPKKRFIIIPSLQHFD